MDWDEDPEMASALSARRSVVASQAKTPEHVENIWKSRRSNEAGMAQHSKLMSQTMSKTNSRKLRCAECGMTTNAGNLGKHQSASGHVGRQEVSA